MVRELFPIGKIIRNVLTLGSELLCGNSSTLRFLLYNLKSIVCNLSDFTRANLVLVIQHSSGHRLEIARFRAWEAAFLEVNLALLRNTNLGILFQNRKYALYFKLNENILAR